MPTLTNNYIISSAKMPPICIISNISSSNSTNIKTTLNSKIAQLEMSFIQNQPATKRTTLWENILVDIREYNNASNKRSDHLIPLFNRLFILRNNSLKPNTVEELIKFLRNFSKTDSTYLLFAYIQTYTNPDFTKNIDQFPENVKAKQYINQKPQEFLDFGIGDCGDMALLVATVLDGLGIENEIIDVKFSLKRLKNNGANLHVITYFHFSENGQQFSKIMDNETFKEVTPSKNLKKVIISAGGYFEDISGYQIVDREYMKNNPNEFPLPNNQTEEKYFIKIVWIKKTPELIQAFKDIPLDLIFENPQDELLIFKNDAPQIIEKQSIPEETKKSLYIIFNKAFVRSQFGGKL